MNIINVHMNNPIELRFTIVDDGRETVRFIFLSNPGAWIEVAPKMADNINSYFKMKANGFPYDYKEADHIAGILADAPRYGTD